MIQFDVDVEAEAYHISSKNNLQIFYTDDELVFATECPTEIFPHQFKSSNVLLPVL